jgi:Xaa-Pro aminopeptidase
MKPETLLMVADSEHDANMLHAVRLFIPDPFIHVRIGDETHVLVSDLEIDRVRRQARHCQVHSLSQYRQRCSKSSKKPASTARIIKAFLSESGKRKVLVPANFPHGLARELRRLRVRLKVKEGLFFPEREIKTADQVKKISAALMMAEVGLAEGIQALKRAKIGKNGRLLIQHNVPLTSERLRAIIDVAVIQAGGLATHTIVACGRQGCDPHEGGSGGLTANQPIVIDIFPRSRKTGYFGDLTRTVVRGQSSEQVRKMYHAVSRAQDLVFAKLGPGVPAQDLHSCVQAFFEQEGFKTTRGAGRLQGFFHGTGHGVGLELHEAPRIGPASQDILRDGHVLTVEPGLYYPSIGGVRLEDMAFLTSQTARNLTKFEKTLEI